MNVWVIFLNLFFQSPSYVEPMKRFGKRRDFTKIVVVMNNMTSINVQEISGGSAYWANGEIQRVGVNHRYGSGYLSEVVTFHSGIFMVIQNFSLYGNRGIRIFPENRKENPPVISFFISFSGIRNISYAKPRAFLGDGLAHIEFPGYKPSLSVEVENDMPVRTLTVCMAPAAFEKLTGKSTSELVEALEIFDHNAGRKGAPDRLKRIDFAQNLCTSQAMAFFRDTPGDCLLLEAKALELVALQLKQLEYLTGKTRRSRPCDPSAEKIFYACEILRKEMANPPSKLELARRVRLNYNQLIHGFKTTLGMLPFEYLRAIRLEKTYNMIINHECNITEAAFNAGYTSLSHFSKSFRKQFGINPKELGKRNTGRSNTN